jgi:hypothetical protein
VDDFVLARIVHVVAVLFWIGGVGFVTWMVHRAEMWSRFADPSFWWMHAMVALWAVFTLMLFIIEPLFLHCRLATSRTPQADFARLERVHHILIMLSLITLGGAVGGSHGLF